MGRQLVDVGNLLCYTVFSLPIHLNKKKLEHCRACGTGRGTLECLTQLERRLTHMGMRAYDRIPVARYNREYMLAALYEAGKTYATRLETGFDMYYRRQT